MDASPFTIDFPGKKKKASSPRAEETTPFQKH